MGSVNKSVFAKSEFVLPAQPALTTSRRYWTEAGVFQVNENFRAQFLDLVVPAVARGKFLLRHLEDLTPIAPIVIELADKVETPVSQLRAFMKANQRKSGHFYAFAVGNDAQLWTIGFFWHGDDFGIWDVSALPVVGSDYLMDTDEHILSRK